MVAFTTLVAQVYRVPLAVIIAILSVLCVPVLPSTRLFLLLLPLLLWSVPLAPAIGTLSEVIYDCDLLI